MASTKLRKTFQYQEDGSDGDEPEALDEQEQEELIAKLKQENDEQNDNYLKAFLIIPCTSSILFVGGLIRARSASACLLCLLGATSLWATAYNLFMIPTGGSSQQRRPAKIAGVQLPVPDSRSPAQKYVPILNAALSMLVAVGGLRFRTGGGVIEGFWLMCWLPLLEYLMIQMARRWLVEVDPAELEKLKYELRGA